jgi:vacuolar-type H+-ATPase subunit H
MPGVRDLLDRFRPAGAPGAASATGVPADRRADLDAELEPVFAALAPVEAECDRAVHDAERDAARTAAWARSRAAALVAAAEEAVSAERAGAAARAAAHGRDEADRVAEAGRRDAERVRRRAHRLLPGVVAEGTARLRADIDALLPAGQPGRG